MKEVPLERVKGGYASSVVNNYGGAHGVILVFNLEQNAYFLNTDEMKAYRLTEEEIREMRDNG
jgi:hypothetical protein